MKTLDEVIEQHEFCLAIGDSACGPNCRWREKDGVCRMREDALHYLKQYRSDKGLWESDKKGYEDWIEQYKEAREKHQQAVIKMNQNPPLTWEELRQMEGKPVWVEHKHYSKWLIVYEVYENTIVLDGNGCYTQYFSDDNDKEVRWKAYRKERK